MMFWVKNNDILAIERIIVIRFILYNFAGFEDMEEGKVEENYEEEKQDDEEEEQHHEDY